MYGDYGRCQANIGSQSNPMEDEEDTGAPSLNPKPKTLRWASILPRNNKEADVVVKLVQGANVGLPCYFDLPVLSRE